MRWFTFFALLTGCVIASPLHQLHPKRQEDVGIGALLQGSLNAGYGKRPAAPGDSARRVVLANRTPQLADAKTVKLRYGPYSVPNMTRKNDFGEMGTLYNYPDTEIERPCEGDCVLLGITAGLEYGNGTEADLKSGMWLHHMVAFTVSPQRKDPTCAGLTSLPAMAIGSDSSHSERFFAAGNEKSNVKFNPPWVKDEMMGYYLYKNDKVAYLVDLMNQNQDDRTVYMTITYDFIEGRPEAVSDIKAIWLDVEQCGTSEYQPPTQSGSFSAKYSWNATVDGEILGAGGHLHDGGTHLSLAVDGKQICDSIATYGTADKAEGGPAMAPMAAAAKGEHSHGGEMKGMGGEAVEHITKMSACHGETLGIEKIQKGQKWDMEAYYDYGKFKGMKNEEGKQTSVMGIAVMYVKNPKM